MVKNRLRAPYVIYFTPRTILRRPVCGRNNNTLIYIDIVRCPVKLRYYLNFTTPVQRFVGSSDGAHTAFCRVIGGKETSDGARLAVPNIGRAPDDFVKI